MYDEYDSGYMELNEDEQMLLFSSESEQSDGRKCKRFFCCLNLFILMNYLRLDLNTNMSKTESGSRKRKRSKSKKADDEASSKSNKRQRTTASGTIWRKLEVDSVSSKDFPLRVMLIFGKR